MSAERWKDDEALLESLRKGAPGAVDELLRLYQGKIFNLAMSILKNESDAEEAAQDVFMTVIRKVGTFQGNSAFYSWIYRICVNTCLMRLRGKRRNETVSIEEFMPVFTDEGMHASPMDDWSKEVERDALNEELGQMIRKFTEELSEKYRVVFVLSDVEGLSNEETAKILGLTVPAIKSRLHRARLYLREQLSRYLRKGKPGDAMICKELAYMLADYCNGSMDPRLREELDDHLSRCEPCMAFTKTFQATCEETRKLREAIEYAIPDRGPPTAGVVRPGRGAQISRKDAGVPGAGRAGPAGKGRGFRRGGDRRNALLGRGAPHGEPLRRLPGVRRVFRRVAENRHPAGRRSPPGIRSHLIALMQALPPGEEFFLA